MAHVSDAKKKTVKEMVALLESSPIVGVVNMENLPAPPLQSMRSVLRGKVTMYMTKKRLMKIAFKQVKDKVKGIDTMEKYLGGMPALLFTKENPFSLTKTLSKNKTAAPAKAGQTAPDDIVIKAGPTPFAPGPIISELSSIGLKTGVENGKVAVKEDSVVAERGEKIKPKVAEVLTRLDIKPMKVGLDLVAVLEQGVVYEKDILEVDEQAYLDKVNKAAQETFNLAFELGYVVKENIEVFISKAFTDAKGVGLEAGVSEKELMPDLLSKAERSMLSLKAEANVPDAPTAEAKAEEAPQEEVKQEEKKEEPKAEEKKEAPAEKKEEPKAEEKQAEKKEEPKDEEPKPAQAPEEKKAEEKPAEKPKEPEAPKESPKPEEKKEEPKAEAKAEEKKPDDKSTDEKVKDMVEKTKAHEAGTEPTADKLLEESKEEKK